MTDHIKLDNEAGVLARVSATWVAITALIVIGLGLILAVTSSRTARCSCFTSGFPVMSRCTPKAASASPSISTCMPR